MDSHWEFSGQTDAHTRVNSKVPIPTKVGGPKSVNDKIPGIGTCKFEFATIKNHYNDIHNGILDKHQKKPQKGHFSPKRAPGHTQELSRSTDKQNYVASN